MDDRGRDSHGRVAKTTTAALSRRDFLIQGGAAVSLLSASGCLAWASRAAAGDVIADLYITEGVRDLSDGRKLYLQGFSLGPDVAPEPNPRAVINAITGDRVTFNVTNTLTKPHNLRIDGVGDTGPIAPGQTKSVTFDAPSPGAYLYYDSGDAPLNRVLGLHGAMIVREPSETATEYLWVFNAFDSRLAARVSRGTSVSFAEFVPDVFTINGRFGDFSCNARDTSPRQPFGTPVRIRMVNASTFAKSIHFHGEHPVVARRTIAQQQTVGAAKDVFMLSPQEVVEVTVQFSVPSDGFPVNAPGPGQTDLIYPVHDHHELTQTLGGGLYPNGMLTDLVFEVDNG
jgi:FtsP/CotA-like multicopper oxidase with cupredoxin domain